MELVGIIRVLWRRRILVGLGALTALAAGVFATHQQTDSALARVRVLADTPSSLVTNVRARGDDTIATRAVLLSSLMTSDEMRVEIAREAALEPSELAVVDPDFGSPAVATPLSREAVEFARPTEPNVVTVSVGQVPIVSILTKADDPDAAARLAEAATAALASLGRQPEPLGNRGVNLQRLGSVEVERVVNGPGRAEAASAAAAIFGLWCSVVVLFDWIIRRRSSATAPEIGRRAPPQGSPQPAALGYARSLNGAARDRAGPPAR